MDLKYELTIILPIYNPQKGWEKALIIKLTEIQELFKSVRFKTIIVNDGSTKNITNDLEVLKKKYSNLEIISYAKNRGKGFAVKKGLQNATSNFYVYTDWDFPFGVDVIHTSYKTLKNTDYDVVIGTRTVHYYKQLPFLRQLISINLRILNFILLGFKNIDTQAGLKGINEKGKSHFLATKTDSFIFEFEFIKRILKGRLKINYLKVFLKEDIVFTNFSIRTLNRELMNLIKVYVKN